MNETQEYQEIDLVALFMIIIRKWWLILLLMVVAGGTSYYVTTNYVTPIYRASATLFIGKDSDGFGDLNLGDLSVDSKLLSDYSELIKTRLITGQVINELALNVSRGSLVSNLGVSVIGESRFMYVTFTDPIPERSEIVVNTMAKILAEEAERIIGVKNVQIVDYAITPTYPISPSVSRNVMIAAVLGAMVALGLIFIQMLMDNSIKTEEDIEKSTGVPVLGVIPEFKGEVRKA